ncbi:MAG: hypothetical protein LQ349_004095 [Xanthoria aureola]|nr:MAG: hypothetical protein LQ349_004095 [Xanthoria aureola]
MAGQQIPVIDISNIDEASVIPAFQLRLLIDFSTCRGLYSDYHSRRRNLVPSARTTKVGLVYIQRRLIRSIRRVFNFGEFVNGKAQQPMPPSLAQQEAEINDFADRCRGLCMQLLRLFALGLKIDETDGGQAWFARHHDASKGPSGSILRLLYYPAPGVCEQDPDASALRAGAHSDYGSITLLFQRSAQPGLEVLSPQAHWSSVPVWPPGTEEDQYPPILVNVGDLLSYWTNGFLKSTVHRVVFPPNGASTDRYSVAYFCHPANDTKLAPVPSEVVTAALDSTGIKQDVLGGSRTLTAEDHLRSRLAATYGWEKGADGES